MPALLFVSQQILLLLALSFLVSGVRGLALKRLLAFLLLLSLPFVSPVFIPTLLLIFAAFIALAQELTRENTKETPGKNIIEVATKVTEEIPVEKGREENSENKIASAHPANKGNKSQDSFRQTAALLLSCVYLGSWIFFVFSDTKAIFKLLPLDSDFHPASWQTLLEEVPYHLWEAASSLPALLLGGMLALHGLLQWRKANGPHKR